jgi:L-fuconolactonase
LLDSHHHFWRYDPAEYGWINDSMAGLRRDFLPADLKPEIDAVGIEGVVSVQARQSLDETRWLLGLADQHDFIRGVVGWVPLISPSVASDLEPFAANPKLKAVRHVLQDEPDPDFMLRTDFNEGIWAIERFGLAYDILVYERQLPQTIRFVDRHPRQIFVLDHIAKPRIRDNLMAPWQENIRELARRENVYCKLSGVVTEADWQGWTIGQLHPYLETAIEAFGPRRLMFGSDWPVCLLACKYANWHRLVRDFTRLLSPDEQRRIFGETAIEAYKL